MNSAIATLLELEAREALWDRQVLGYPVWPELRLGCYHRLLQQGSPPPTSSQVERRRLSRQRLPASVQDLVIKLVPALRACDVWVLGSTRYRRMDGSGESPSIFVKDLEQQLGPRLLFLETNLTRSRRSPRRNLVYIDALRDLVRSLSSRSSSWLPAAWARGLDRPELGVDARAVLREAVYGQTWSRVARILFGLARPRALVVLCAYDQHIPFQLEARRAGIPIIELQHGVIHESHPGYVFGPGVTPPHAPDHLVVFGEHYGQLLERSSTYWLTRWSVGGHPWLKAKREERAQRQPGDAIALFGQNVSSVQRRLHALSIQLRAELPSVRIVLKPHPAEKDIESVYAGLRERGVELASPSSDSYALLASCRVAVSVFSTIAVEALAFRCTSVVLRSPHWFEDIRAFVESGFLQVADDVRDVVSAYHRARATDATDIDQRLFGTAEKPLDFLELIEDVGKRIPTKT